MRLKRNFSAVLAVIILSTLLFSTAVFANSSDSSYNRFNVIFVTDASGSMKKSDSEDLRFDAIDLFINLLAEKGNYLGGIAFSTKILSRMEPKAIDSAADKKEVSDMLRGVPVSGWTNTGEALSAAVEDLVKSGNPDYPSVIVLLSDGNTEMGTDEETEASLELKAEALQAARESGAAIYSVCLNNNGEADIKEMEQISNATGGTFMEVEKAEDLQEVFNTFYDLIYGTSTILLGDEEFPESGVIEKPFDIPGIGVEEINIIVYGKTSILEVIKPDGTTSSAEISEKKMFTTVKATDIVPGTWMVRASGVPKDRIKINMVYNTNLGVDVSTEPSGSAFEIGSDVKLTARLRSASEVARDASQYVGYSAELKILDAYGDLIKTVPMQLAGDHYEAALNQEEGVYNYVVSVSGNHIAKESDQIGPIKFTVPEEVVIPNTPPVPVEEKVEKTVFVWPFVKNDLEIDLNELATDAEDSELKYKVVSSSFIEGDDYTVSSDQKIDVTNFSLSKGAFTIRAFDSEGLNCDIEVIVKSHKVATIALIGLGAAALIVLAAFGVMTYILLNKRFMGVCYVQKFDDQGNYYEEVKREKNRGRIKLAAFGIGQCDLDANKCYFQASGKNYVYFITNKKVYGSGKLDKKFKVDGTGYEVTISTDQMARSGIRVRFVSRMNNTNFY